MRNELFSPSNNTRFLDSKYGKPVQMSPSTRKEIQKRTDSMMLHFFRTIYRSIFGSGGWRRPKKSPCSAVKSPKELLFQFFRDLGRNPFSRTPELQNLGRRSICISV